MGGEVVTKSCSVVQSALRTASSIDVVELTDSEEDNVIDLTSSQSDSEVDKEHGSAAIQQEQWFTPNSAVSSDGGLGKQTKRDQSLAKGTILTPATKLSSVATRTPVTVEPLYLDDDDGDVPDYTEHDDGAILILDEPKSARKPLPIGTKNQKDPIPTYTKSPRVELKDIPKARISKSHATVERGKRIQYAQQLFEELNDAIFKNDLPKETKLTWNKRLLTTAGRAKWRKTKDGSHCTEIELSEKILDCNERIRNTLSHEMCHLATWVIDADPKQGHGRLFKCWAAKVMKKRPEIKISTRHNYEISYPYQWKCEQCAKIYGRFSRSIRPDECVCGACKEGRLVPLFSVRQRIRKADGDDSALVKSKMSVTRDSSSDGNADLGSESEVESLLTTLNAISIVDT